MFEIIALSKILQGNNNSADHNSQTFSLKQTSYEMLNTVEQSHHIFNSSIGNTFGLIFKSHQHSKSHMVTF
jgi:hypothetical protein